MTKTLQDIIYYDGIIARELTNPNQSLAVEQLIDKLNPLEDELLRNPDGRIDLQRSGNKFISGYPNELSKRIQQLM